MVSKKVTKEGEVMSFHQHNLKLETSDEDGRLFLAWPTTVEHKITENSPLWETSATDLIHRHFEVVVIMEGIVESTGMTTQARTSYLPSEILWGHRFDQEVSFRPESGQYVVDFSKLNATTPFSISGLSAKERAEKRVRTNCGSACVDEVLEKHEKKTVKGDGGKKEEAEEKEKKEEEEEEEEEEEKEKEEEEKMYDNTFDFREDMQVRPCQSYNHNAYASEIVSETNRASNPKANSLHTQISKDEQKKKSLKIKIPKLKVSSRRATEHDDSNLSKMVAAHMASTAFSVIGATSLLPANEDPSMTKH